MTAKRAALVLTLVLTFCSVTLRAAEESKTEPERPHQNVNRNKGYAFAQPHILLDQRLFGLAHGIRLLAETCADDPQYGHATQQAYTQWLAAQTATLAQIYAQLSGYYDQNKVMLDATAIAQHLHLPAKLTLQRGTEQFNAACATLPEALTAPRYDLAALRRSVHSKTAAPP